MEGHGEGLVAIVQGLDAPGVTLTVCSRPRLHQERRRSSRHRMHVNPMCMTPEMCSVYQGLNSTPTQPVAQKASVETSTDCVKATVCVKSTTGAQICDGRYASSYKMAHCKMTPTSPPEVVTEFPPQRKEPCRNHGNFEIGQQWSGHDNADASRHSSGPSADHDSSHVRVSASRGRQCTASQISGEKVSVHHLRSYRDMEAFAQSLRKYPSIEAYRTASSDLIEKIIRYTQAKSSQEASRTTKSMRCLQQQKSSEPYDTCRTSKHQQTYTRKQDDVTSNTYNLQDRCKERARNFKLYSTRNIKDSPYKESMSSSYDYLKAGNSRCGRSYHSDGSPSPEGSRSPAGSRSPTGSRSPERSRSPAGSRSPERSKSHVRTNCPDRASRPDRAGRLVQPASSARDLSLSDMSKYIRSVTIRQICKERPLVFQVCPKLKNRYDQHKKICPNKTERSNESLKFANDNDAAGQASGSILSRLMTTLSGCTAPSTTQDACQCFRSDCCCSKATQCTFGPDTPPNDHMICNCNSSAIKFSPNVPCSCSGRHEDQAYYNKRIDEEISEWLKDVPVHSIECPESKKKREIAIIELQKTLKHLPDDENFGENAAIEINKFVEDLPMWYPGTDKEEEMLFKNQLADKLTDKILSISRKSDRFKDIVKKWIVHLDLEDDDEEIDAEVIIDNIVNKLKSLAADRPSCNIKYTRVLNNAITELLIDLSLFDGDMVTLKTMANKLAAEVVALPKNVDIIGAMTSDLTSELKDIVSDWICEHGLCKELKKDPKLIIGLAKKLNALKSQGMDDKMKEEMHQFEDDVGTAFKTIDELIEELTKQLSGGAGGGQTTQRQPGKLNEDVVSKVIIDWLHNLPGCTNLQPQEFDKITKEFVKLVQEGAAHGYDTLGNDMVDYLMDTNLSIDPIALIEKVEELLKKLNIVPSNRFYKEKAEKKITHDIFDIIDRLPLPEEKKEEMKSKSRLIIHKNVNRSESNIQQIENDVKEGILEEVVEIISDIDLLRKSIRTLKSATRFSTESTDLKAIISKDVKSAVNELPIDTHKKRNLMQQVNGTLSKNMDKPLPNNVKSTINDEISDIVEKCPIAEDRGVVSCLKRLLSAVASNHLNMFLPKIKCVCDIQSKVEHDVAIVIDDAPIDAAKKRDLKNCIRNILKENEDCRLSDEVVKTLREDINGAVSDLSIPEDKKDILKNVVGETVTKDVGEASSALRHDLNKIRNKLLDDTINVIEKCPVNSDVKSHLTSKLEPMLARNLDSSLSDEEKYTIIGDVSDIVKSAMPEDKRRSLENKLAKNLNTYKTEEQEGLTEVINNSLNNTLQEMEQVMDKAPIPKEKKAAFKKKMREIANNTFNKPLTDDVLDIFNNNINEILDELNLPKDDRNKLKNELTRAVDKNISNLRKEIKDIETKSPQSRRRASMDTSNKYGKKGKPLKPIKEVDETKSRRLAKRDGSDIKSPYAKRRSSSIDYKAKRTKSSSLSITGPLTPKETMKHEVKRTVRKAEIPEEKKSKLRLELTTMLSSLYPLMDDSLGRKMAVKEEMKDLFSKYGIDPSYENQLTEELNYLVDIALKGGDLEEARRKLIEKIMRETNLSEEEAAALADEMIEKARRLAVKEELRDLFDKYGIDSRYENELAEEFNKLIDLALTGGDLEEARRKLIKKLMRDTNLTEEQATALADEMISRARERLLAAKAKDSCATSYLYEKCFTKAISESVDQSSIPESEKSSLKDNLTTKLKEIMKETGFIHKEDVEAIKDRIVTDCNNIVDATSIQADQKDELKLSLNDAMNKCITEVNKMLGAGDDEAFAIYEDKIKDCIKTYMDSLGLQLDPTILEAFINDLVGDIIDRHKYLIAHPEIIVTVKDEMENFNYQVFRRAKKHMGLKTTLQVMKGTGELYKMILALGSPLPSSKLPFRREKAHYSGKRRPDQAPRDRKNTGTALLSEDVNYALQESLARDKYARKQWTKNLSEINNILSTTRRVAEGSKSNRRLTSPSRIRETPSSRRTSLLEAFAVNKTEQKSPFCSNSKDFNEKEFTKFVNDSLKTWLEKAGVNIKQKQMNEILKELTRDIVDRRKFLQMYGSDGQTQCDDLEYLKVQVHRRLNALVPADALKPVLEDTKEFLAKVDNFKMPQSGAPESGKDTKQPRNSTTSTNGAVKEDTLGQGLSGTNFSPGQTSTPAKPRNSSDLTGKESINLKNKLKESIRTWIDSVPINLDEEMKTAVIDDIATDVVERQEYMKLYPEKTFTKEEEIENLRFQVFNKISKVLGPDAELNISKEKIEELYKTIMGQRRSLTPKQEEELQAALRGEIAVILSNYNITCQDKRELQPSLTCELLKLKNSSADQDEIVENMIAIIKRFNSMRTCHPCDEEAEEIALKLLYRTKKIISRILESKPLFHGCPMSNEKRSLMESQLAEEYARDLGIPLGDSEFVMNSNTGKGRYGLSFNGLSNFIDTRISSINSDDETLNETAKKEIAYSLIQRVGEMNVDPAIFNDDALYEAVLRDELQNLFGDVALSDEEMQALKEDLLEKVLEAHHRAHDEIAGQTYKQNLRDTISKLLPDQRNLSMEEQATLDTLKDQLADAFIDLHYSGGNEDQINNLRRKISNEINEFCKIFLNRNPCAPINSQKLSRDLYTALMNVPVPTGDSIIYEVEQARIREEINDWLRELPLGCQNATELSCRNKMIYVLSRKLFDIEAEAGDTANELMKKEIVKFLTKMPLEPGEDNETHADKLIDKLKCTELSRKYDATSNVTIDACGNISAVSAGSGRGSAADGSICPAYKSLLEKQNASGSSKVCGQPCKQPEPLPPCTLSTDDRSHLDSIKRRTCLSPDCVRALMRKNKCNICASPRPVDAGSQTVLRPLGMEMQNPICPVANDRSPRPCPGVPVGSSHQPCSQVRRPESLGVDKAHQASPCPAIYDKITRPCPAVSTRGSPQSGQSMRRHTISSGNMPECIEEVQPQIIIKQYYWNPEKTSFEESELQQPERRSCRHQSDAAPCNQSMQTQNVTRDQSSMNSEPKSQRQTPSDRNSYWDAQKSFQRTTPCPRTPCVPSPCTSPFGLDQTTPPCSPGCSRDSASRTQKRDGLQDLPYSSSRPSRKERVIELGSLDDLCNPRPKKRNSDNGPDWSSGKGTEDDSFWNTPMRRVVLDEGIDESLVMEREQREERIRCKCKERLVPKCGRSQSRTSPRTPCPQCSEEGQSLNRCSKCCGLHCPYPSYFYFK